MAGNSQTLTTRLVVDDEASKPTEEFAKKLEGLDNETATVVLALKAAGVQQDLADLLADISQLDASDPEITIKVEQAAQAKTELDSLQGQIQKLNATDVDINTQPAEAGLHRVAKEGDSSRSVLANMVGNSASELGEVGGIAGTAGQALGQMGEYAADGQISLAGLAGVAGPMAALAVVTWGLQRAQKAQAESAKKAAEETKKLSEVADDQVWITLQEAITAAARAGQSADEVFEKMAEDNLPGLKRALEAATASGEANAFVLDHMKSAIDNEEASRKQATQTTKDYGEAQAETAATMDRVTSSTDGTTAATDRLRGQMDLLQGSLNFDRAALNFQRAMEGAQQKARDGVALTQEDILGLKDNYLTVAEQLGTNPIEVQSNLNKIEQGDIDSVFFTTQTAINAKGDVDLTVTPKVDFNALKAQIRTAQSIAANAGGSPSGRSATQTINVNLPRGSRSSDVTRAMSAHTRRAGRRYGAPVVTRAR